MGLAGSPKCPPFSTALPILQQVQDERMGLAGSPPTAPARRLRLGLGHRPEQEGVFDNQHLALSAAKS